MRSRLPDAWRLAVGTLTAIPVLPPKRIDRDTAGLAMVLAPLAVAPLGIVVGLILWAGRELGVDPFATGLLAVGALALGSRAFHIDGLADTADGLTASYDREQSLEVMRSGTVGPAGVAAIVIVLLIQAGGLDSLAFDDRDLVLAGAVVCASRVAVTLTSMRGISAARADGLGATHAGSVPRLVVVAQWLAVGAALAATSSWAGEPWWRVVVGLAVAAAVVGLLIRRAVRRLGGVTGDIYGAAIEITLAILVLSVAPPFVFVAG
ncbi:MAG: adenosylcobinamide-GDP ribazoletransferase [Aeromicrobium sp.]